MYYKDYGDLNFYHHYPMNCCPYCRHCHCPYCPYRYNQYYNHYNHYRYMDDLDNIDYMDDMVRQMPPNSKPPTFTPQKPQTSKSQFPGGPSTKAIDSGSIRPCIGEFVYIWEVNGRSYWAYITFVGRRSLSGFRWFRGRWVYFGLDLNRIDSFVCF